MIGPVAILEPASDEMRLRIVQLCDGFTLRFVSSTDDQEMMAAVEGATYVVTRGVRFPEAIMAHAKALKLVHQWGTGVDGIPLEAARARGITVARSPGLNAPTVAESTLALMLATLRRLPQVHTAFRAGQWTQPDLWRETRDLGGCRVGLIGMGAIGQEVLKRLTAFGCEIGYFKPSGHDTSIDAGFMSFDELVGWADVLSLHLPLTPETRHMINAKTLAAMKPGAVLINTSRGGLVDEAALIDALTSGHLAAAGLDVFENEPVTQANALLTMPNTVTLPHVAGRTLDNFDRMVRHWSGNIRAHAEGHTIDPACIVVP